MQFYHANSEKIFVITKFKKANMFLKNLRQWIRHVLFQSFSIVVALIQVSLCTKR